MKENKKKKSIGFSYALFGIIAALKKERNLKIHFSFAIVVILFSFIFRISVIEWLIVLVMIALVIVLELINSAIEHIIDYIKPAITPEAKYIKDVAAGAVLFAACFSVIIGIIIFAPKIFL